MKFDERDSLVRTPKQDRLIPSTSYIYGKSHVSHRLYMDRSVKTRAHTHTHRHIPTHTHTHSTPTHLWRGVAVRVRKTPRGYLDAPDVEPQRRAGQPRLFLFYGWCGGWSTGRGLCIYHGASIGREGTGGTTSRQKTQRSADASSITHCLFSVRLDRQQRQDTLTRTPRRPTGPIPSLP